MIAQRTHLFPFRTQKLSSITPKVVAGSLAARIGRCGAVHRECSEKSAFALIRRENGRYRRGVRVWPKEHGWKPCKQGIVSRVRIPSSPLWTLSSAGRAPALQAGGHRFDPCSVHWRKSRNRHVGIKRCRLSSVGRAPLL